MNQVDFIIVGQGLCGTWLSYYLQEMGKTVLVFDEAHTNTASRVASGVINPVTGRRIVRTWMIEDLLPFAWQQYQAVEQAASIKLINETVLDFFATPQMQDSFLKRLPEEKDYLHEVSNQTYWTSYFDYPFSMGMIAPCYLIHLGPFLNYWRKKLEDNGALITDHFDESKLVFHANSVRYHEWTAEKIIFCDGIAGFRNPFFDKLPHAANKGEAIIARIPDLPRNFIYKQGLSIVPWQHENDFFWIGSTYEWSFTDTNITEAFRKKLITQLSAWLKLPFSIEEHLVAVRPATLERRPFVGFHPLHHQVGILNGMGTKGCSLAPWFALELANHIVNKTPINPLADVKRHARILSR